MIKESKISTLIYQKVLFSNGTVGRFWRFMRKIAIRMLDDPCCRMEIHGKMMSMPLSHWLPLYLKSKQLYDRLPKKISEFQMRNDGYIKCIDIGANIGDTITAFRVDKENRFLAIEPNPRYRSYLDANWGHDDNVMILSVLCSSGESISNFVVKEINGTAQIHASDHGLQIQQLTVDQILKTTPGFEDVNIMKIDTDGYDLQILQGAEKLITTNKPAVLFECDAFTSSSYQTDFFKCMDIFQRAGYEGFILYDNYGNYMGTFNINIPDFKFIMFNLLSWQQNTHIIYYDILFLHGRSLADFIDKHHHAPLNFT